MLRNYFIIAIRNLNKYRFYSIINIFGLTIGITACLIILLYVRFELSFDKYNVNADRIYRVDWELFLSDNYSHKAAVTPPMAETIVRDYPEVEAATRFRYMGAFHFKRDEENTVEWRVVYADNDLFKIFTLPFIAGNPENALKDPYSMVISEKCAAQFFPGEDALGKIMIKDNKDAYKITGVIRDIPDNSHFHYRMFLSMEGLEESKNNYWIGSPYNTYLLLRKGADPGALEAKLPDMVEKYLIPQAASVLGATFMEDFKAGGNTLTLHLRPLLNIHLHSDLQNELEGNGDIANIYLLTAIALFILIIACINFMNLATARSANRAREVGIRKVLGSDRLSLIFQFLAESMIISILSFFLALALTDIMLQPFNNFTGLSLSIPWNHIEFYLFMIIAAMVVGVFAGLYPSMVLSGFRPVKVLTGNFSTGPNSFFLRSTLVIFQFFISIFLIIVTIALYQQMNFIKNKKLGFNKEQVIIIRDVYNSGDKLPVIRDEILKNNHIINGTISAYFPGPGSSRKTPMLWKYGSDPTPDNSVNAEKWTVDYDYIPTLGMEIVEGRNFSRDFSTDSAAVILNETAVRRFGFKDDPIGQMISTHKDNPDGSQDRNKQETWTVVGVVKDFNFESLRENVGPLGLFFGTDSRSFLTFRYEADRTDQVIETIKNTWDKMAPGEPFNYSFLDQDFERMYAGEQKLGSLFALFSGLAIVIACLGLFALTAFTTEQRTKEIGIRKVLGASVQTIILLLSKEFSRLIIIAFLLAVPLAWYGIYWHFQQYAYKTSISPMVYLGAGILAFLLACLTMFYQSIKAANTNPVNTLRSE
ncbi:MAG: ABC transporter permease [Cyclobacteriaceae bacterium]|nr:ABC transporter permease [Cyclobacteriaceae bacterium]